MKMNLNVTQNMKIPKNPSKIERIGFLLKKKTFEVKANH